MRTGIFVGSFNPPTKAHFSIAHILYNDNFLDKIVFVPVNNDKKDLISLEKRIEMLDLYTKNYNYLQVSNIMEEFDCFNYKVLEELNKVYNNIYIIMGSDLLERFSFFDNYQDMLEKYHFIIIERFNINCIDIINKYYKDYENKFTILNYNNNISSSLVREKIIKKEDISNMVDDCIIEYINESKLYQVD